MSKSVLISIQPKWCELIANGKKTIEVRKTKPKLETPFKCYIYCTKGTPYLNWHNKNVYVEEKDILGGRGYGIYQRLNKKVIGYFVCDEINEISPSPFTDGQYIVYGRGKTMLRLDEFQKYLGYKIGYGWHISDLKIYDEPKELSEFNKPCDFNYACFLCDRAVYDKKVITDISGKITKVNNKFIACDDVITRPPQSWCYVEELK